MMQSAALGALAGSSPEPGGLPVPSLFPPWRPGAQLGLWGSSLTPCPEHSWVGGPRTGQNRPFRVGWVNRDAEGGVGGEMGE